MYILLSPYFYDNTYKNIIPIHSNLSSLNSAVLELTNYMNPYFSVGRYDYVNYPLYVYNTLGNTYHMYYYNTYPTLKYDYVLRPISLVNENMITSLNLLRLQYLRGLLYSGSANRLSGIRDTFVNNARATTKLPDEIIGSLSNTTPSDDISMFVHAPVSTAPLQIINRSKKTKAIHIKSIYKNKI